MKTLVSTLACLLGIVASASAGPLDPAHVPQDAKWVVHVDLEALGDSQMMEAVRNEWPQATMQARQWMEKHYGIDPREDLLGVTMFSDTYDSHTGAAILFADYNREKAIERIKSNAQVETTEWRGHTLYTWQTDGYGMKAKGRERAAEDAGGGRADRRRAAKEPHTMTAALLDNKVVFAPSVERAKSVVSLLEGEAPSQKGQQSKLLAKMTDEAIFYGSAIDLENIARRESIFPILQQHEHIVWMFGERDSELFEEVLLVGKNDQVAQQMKTALEGLVALTKVWAADTQHLAGLYDNVQIQQDGATVHVKWEGQTEQVAKALGEFRDLVEKWREAGQEQVRRRPSQPGGKEL